MQVGVRHLAPSLPKQRSQTVEVRTHNLLVWSDPNQPNHSTIKLSYFKYTNTRLHWLLPSKQSGDIGYHSKSICSWTQLTHFITCSVSPPNKHSCRDVLTGLIACLNATFPHQSRGACTPLSPPFFRWNVFSPPQLLLIGWEVTKDHKHISEQS